MGHSSLPKVAVILPAAGGSTRFGGPVKKPFVDLAGKPVWLRAVELFCHRPDVTAVYLVLGPGEVADFRLAHGVKLGLVYGNVHVVAGGSERFESVANALAVVPADVELVAVHDAVRPLTPTAVVDAVFARAAATGAAMLAIPVADTLKRVDPATGMVTGTVPRAELWQAQTPQVFRRDWLVGAYAGRAGYPGAVTDDAQLVEAAGHPVSVVVGSPRNFKITTADDLATAEALLAERREAAPVRPFHDEDEARW